MAVDQSESALAPLVPSDLDLRDFPFMPVDIVRLFGSEFHARSDDAAWRAGVTLWLRSYHQVPASSVPDDDVALARLAEFARDLKGWRKIRAAALHGWVKCSDGRLYHPVVAEKALEGWIEKQTQRKVSAAGNAKRHRQAFDATPFDSAIQDALTRLAILNPQSRILSRRAFRPPDGTVADPENPPDGSSEPPEKSPKRQGREGKEREGSSLRSDPARRASDDDDDDDFAQFIKASPKQTSQDAARRKLDEVLASGVPFAEILAGMERYAKAERGNDLRYIDAPDRWLEKGRWKDGIVPGAPAPPPATPPDKVAIHRSDHRWSALAERYRKSRKVPPPESQQSWLFPTAWIQEMEQVA